MADVSSISIPVLEVAQPIGRFYVGVMTAGDLLKISYVDMRKIESDLDRYVGIQRTLSKPRVREIAGFVDSIDATFPTSVVLAVKGECASFDPNTGMLSVFESEDELGLPISMNEIASILDGQHRVEGLRDAGKLDFQVPVSIFVDADIADQAYIFATVNLAQTKVNKSLVYDLLDYASARSPQKSAHDVAVALDQFDASPLKGLIKRLGAATPGRTTETLAQATVVNSLIPFISKKPEQDRYDLAKGRRVEVEESRYAETPFRALWAAEKDSDVARILLNFFSAVSARWPAAWANREKGQILARTNGFRALMRLLKLIYLKERPSQDVQHAVVGVEDFARYLAKSQLKDEDFNTTNFAPGTSGETAIFNRLRTDLSL